MDNNSWIVCELVIAVVSCQSSRSGQTHLSLASKRSCGHVKVCRRELFPRPKKLKSRATVRRKFAATTDTVNKRSQHIQAKQRTQEAKQSSREETPFHHFVGEQDENLGPSVRACLIEILLVAVLAWAGPEIQVVSQSQQGRGRA